MYLSEFKIVLFKTEEKHLTQTNNEWIKDSFESLISQAYANKQTNKNYYTVQFDANYFY